LATLPVGGVSTPVAAAPTTHYSTSTPGGPLLPSKTKKGVKRKADTTTPGSGGLKSDPDFATDDSTVTPSAAKLSNR